VSGPSFSWSTVITASVALYGAALSTINALWAWRDKRRVVRVSASRGFPVIGPDLGPEMIVLEAVNSGNQSVNLKSAGFRFPDSRQAILPQAQGTVRLPYELKGGDGCNVWADPRDLAFQLRNQGFAGTLKLVPFYVDALGRKHNGKPFDFNIETEHP
jgi:hypothetical protein